MQAIINTAITTDWTDVEIDKTRISGQYMFWSRGGAAFRIRMSGVLLMPLLLLEKK